jgi:hypothetical protein
MIANPRLPLSLVLVLSLQACVSATVNEMTYNEPEAGIGDAALVILGRRHAPDYDTEFDFIDCVGKVIHSGDPSITVINERQFIDRLYPWFEPRIAPMQPSDIDRLRAQEPIQEQLSRFGIEYMIWIDGTTIETNSTGSMTCGVGPGGAGCFGFGTWGNEANYEATIWNLNEQAEVGKVSAETSGQSYMPAVIVPIPIIAPVQDTACESLGLQLLQYFSSEH